MAMKQAVDLVLIIICRRSLVLLCHIYRASLPYLHSISVVSTFVFVVFMGTTLHAAEAEDHRWEHEITTMTNIVDMRFTPEVQSYLRTYLKRNRKKAARIVDRMNLYFPIIENKLAEYKLPDELKYLAIVESALDPKARSRSAAIGLWQLMKPTAKDLGVRIYHSVDERMDPYRSTEAALDYLAQLYDRFGDWELTLAAYNGGPNRVARIMEETGLTDYWSLRPHLPRETANYVPAFIAATYVFSDFGKHGFIPTRIHPDFHFTSKVEIYNHKVYLKDVAELMNIDVDSLKYINPMYKRDYIPESPHGYNLILPNRCLRYFYPLQDTLERTEFVKLASLDGRPEYESLYPDSMENIYVDVTYLVQQKENLFTVAKMFDLDILQLKYWNNFSGLHVDHGMWVDLPIPLIDGKFQLKEYKRIPWHTAVSSVDLNELTTKSSTSALSRAMKSLEANTARQLSTETTRHTIRPIQKGIPYILVHQVSDRQEVPATMVVGKRYH